MSWRDSAACAPYTPGDYPASWFCPPEDFLAPGGGGSKWGAEAAQGVRVCLMVCPVTAKCLAAHYSETYGVWGGTRASDRQRFKRQIRGLTSPEEIEAAAEREVVKLRSKYRK